MKRLGNSAAIRCFSVASALLAAWFVMPAVAQREQAYSGGIVEDWTHHHVVFSNPGSVEDAIRRGRYEEWRRIVTDPRYRLQWMKRYGVAAEGAAVDSFDAAQSSHFRLPDPAPPNQEPPRVFKVAGKQLHADWEEGEDTPGSDYGVAPDQYPAKYTFAPIGTPDCTNDFVVFPIDGPGSSAQADLIAVNNLYGGSCPTSPNPVPNVLFAYNVGTEDVKTSAVLSLDGTKVAFVESISGGSKFHVLTIDKSGNSGCPSSKPCNGRAYNQPAVPGVNNSAVDVRITMKGGVSVTGASPFVDYGNDVAYAGDDDGQLHKFTGVFQGTPAEVTTSPWPFKVAASTVTLTGPVYDSVSRKIFIGGTDGNLYCVTSAGVACGSLSVAAGTSPGPVQSEPIVDSTAGTVFAAASNSTTSYLMQVTTAMGSPVRAAMGVDGTDLYNGAFDNAYFTNISTGHMYFCGNLTTAATPTLWRVTFNSNGTMSSTNDGGSFQLVVSGNKGIGEDCTPLSEAYNASQNKDYLFLGVTDNGFKTGTPNCNNETCLISFALTTSAPFTFPTSAVATADDDTLNLGNHGLSGLIIDNVSNVTTYPGASQIYFSNLQQSTAVQASQSALR